MQIEPHDTMRRGLSALKDDAAVSHPVELIQGNVSLQLPVTCVHGEHVATLLLESLSTRIMRPHDDEALVLNCIAGLLLSLCGSSCSMPSSGSTCV